MPIATKTIPQLTEKDKLRFWAKVNKDGPRITQMESPCWQWTGCKIKFGHGRFRVFGRLFLAHRIIWNITNGEIPMGFLICHKCDNPSCVNTAHLFIGTASDNVRDMVSKKRNNPKFGDSNSSRAHPEKLSWGEKNTSAKLSDEKVRQMRIRHSNGENYSRLGRAYGVSHIAARLAILGKTWPHVK